jgi:hypothetical protein
VAVSVQSRRHGVLILLVDDSHARPKRAERLGESGLVGDDIEFVPLRVEKRDPPDIADLVLGVLGGAGADEA